MTADNKDDRALVERYQAVDVSGDDWGPFWCRADEVDAAIERLTAERDRAYARGVADWATLSLERDQLRARVAELERQLEAIAWRVEPHWKGAGAKLESSWIIKEYNAMADSLSFVEDRLDELQADLSRAREAVLVLHEDIYRCDCCDCELCMDCYHKLKSFDAALKGEV
jgi:hypothetical protein